MRWRHPERGLVLPASFLPSAEESGLLGRIEDRVMEEAFGHIRGWRAHNPSIAVSVNLSADRFRRPELVAQVASLLRNSGVDSSAVQLEITHARPLDLSYATEDTLEGLRDLGIRLTIDNFGTGYSSLGSLHRLPTGASFLSIDRSYVAALGSGEPGAEIVATITSLGHNLGLEVIAEGVENAGQLEALRRMGCDLVQGNHLSEPVPNHRVPELL